MRVIGIDFGERRVGLALGDTEARIASPWRVVQATSDAEAVAGIAEVVKAEGAEALVLGWPRPLGDAHATTPQTERVVAFERELAVLGLPIHREDEALTSRAAAVLARDAGLKGKRDDMAAAAILQTWLDRR